MIVLDTNVISELMRSDPDPTVLAWVDTWPTDQLFITAVTVAELLYGVRRLPDGKRKRDLTDHIEAVIVQDFADRVVSFDDEAARHYAEIVVERERFGRPISMADAQIAAVCRSWSATISTRNVDDFAQTGVPVVNPWVRGAESDA